MTIPQPDHNFIDTLIDELNLKSQAALARLVGVAPPVISKLRNNRLPMGPAILIHFHEATDISIKRLKEMAGLPAYVRPTK